MANSEIILNTQVHQGDSTYSVVGERFRGDGYYGKSDGLHTVQINLSEFVGQISIQGSLMPNPEESDWFLIRLGTGYLTVDTPGLVSEPNSASLSYEESVTDNKIFNFLGNYTWIRARIDFWEEGTVKSIILNH